MAGISFESSVWKGIDLELLGLPSWPYICQQSSMSQGPTTSRVGGMPDVELASLL